MNESHVVITLKEYKEDQEKLRKAIEAESAAKLNAQMTEEAVFRIIKAISETDIGMNLYGKDLAEWISTQAGFRFNLINNGHTTMIGRGADVIKLNIK